MKIKVADKENNGKKVKINVRKYVNCCLLMVAIVLISVIACKVYKAYKVNKIGESSFIRMGGNLQYKDIENATIELPTDGFILISYTKDEKVKKLEDSLQKSVVNNELQNNIYYLDVTELKLEEGYIDSLNKKFGLEDNDKIQEVPALLYYRDGKFMKSLTSTQDRMMSADDFNKLLDSYEIVEND